MKIRFVTLCLTLFLHAGGLQAQLNFLESEQVATSFGSAYNFLAPMDVDEDGDLDVLTNAVINGFGAPGQLAWYRNNGSEGFTTDNEILLSAVFPEYAFDVRIGDLDGDGLQDILSANYPEAGLLWYRNYGGFFSNPIYLDETVVASAIELADLNEDGRNDVIVASENPETGQCDAIVWYLNIETTQFSEQLPLISVNANKVFQLECVDLNNDQNLDILYEQIEYNLQNGSKLICYFNNGNLDFESLPIILDSHFESVHFDVGDLDQDGQKDVVLSIEDDMLVWIKYLGAGNFEQVELVENFPVRRAEIVDVNNDGFKDVVYIGNANNIYWLINLGAGVFSTPIVLAISDTPYFSIKTGDMDQDGDFEIFALTEDRFNIHVYENNCDAVLYADFDYEWVNCSELILSNHSVVCSSEFSIDWDFGNGNFSNEIMPDFPYFEAGIYPVSLTVCDNLECDTYTSDVNIIQTLDYTLPSSGSAGEPIAFIDHSLGYTNWTWVFGDGNTSTDQSTTHIFEEDGSYLVELYITNGNIPDCTHYYSQWIEIGNMSAISNPSIRNRDIQLFPNPANGAVQIELPASFSNGFVQVLNINGAEVYKKYIESSVSNTLQIEIGKGSFIVIIEDAAGNRSSGKLIGI